MRPLARPVDAARAGDGWAGQIGYKGYSGDSCLGNISRIYEWVITAPRHGKWHAYYPASRVDRVRCERFGLSRLP